MHIAINRKPENGCKIQNSSSGKSVVMLHLLIFKSPEDSDLNRVENNEDISRGTLILKPLLLLWDNARRGVCADSYFTSVLSAEELMQIGLKFIGVVKTATKNPDGISIKCRF